MRTTTPANPTTITHRWPWTGEELAIVGVLALAPLAVLAWRGTEALFLPVVVAACCWPAAVALVRLKVVRRRRSQVTAVLDGTRLTVSGGRVGSSRGDVAGTSRVSVQRKGPETVLQLTHRSGALLEVPTRVTAHPALAAVLREHLTAPGVRVDDGAAALVEAL
ncbi:hypothetical protein [Thalassiella azotivora]